jgi:hypothetical protein
MQAAPLLVVELAGTTGTDQRPVDARKGAQRLSASPRDWLASSASASFKFANRERGSAVGRFSLRKQVPQAVEGSNVNFFSLHFRADAI